MPDRIDDDSMSRAAASPWLRATLLLAIGFLLFALGSLLGKWTGSERWGTAIAGSLWTALLVFRSNWRRQPLRRAVVEALVVGAGITALMWVVLP